jgi:hypothetical protein
MNRSINPTSKYNTNGPITKSSNLMGQKLHITPVFARNPAQKNAKKGTALKAFAAT